jgi:hypothetical protein
MPRLVASVVAAVHEGLLVRHLMGVGYHVSLPVQSAQDREMLARPHDTGA